MDKVTVAKHVLARQGTASPTGTASPGYGEVQPGSYHFGPEILNLFAAARDVLADFPVTLVNVTHPITDSLAALERALIELGEESTPARDDGTWPPEQPHYSDRFAGGTGIQCDSTVMNFLRCELSMNHRLGDIAAFEHCAVADEQAIRWADVSDVR
jgi:hypothetical protein